MSVQMDVKVCNWVLHSGTTEEISDGELKVMAVGNKNIFLKLI